MNLTNNIFPIDIKSAVNYGIKKWQKNFYWPVRSPYLYNEILSDLDIAYRKIIAEQKNRIIRENLIVRYKLLIEYANLLYTFKLIQKIYSSGLIIKNHNTDDYYYYIINDTFPKDGFHTKPHILKKEFPFIKRLSDKASSFKSEFKYNYGLGQCFIKRNNKINVVFQPSQFTMEYLKKNVNGRFRFISNSELVSRKVISVSDDVSSECDVVSRRIADMVLSTAQKYSIQISDAASSYIYQLTKAKCGESIRDIYIVYNSLKFKTPITLFTSTPGRYERRILGAAIGLRNDGSKVIGFAHGEYTGHDISSHYIAINLGNIDRFGVFGKKSIPLVEQTMKKYVEYIRADTEIFSIETNFFRNIWNKNKSKKVPKKIKKVMLIGIAYSQYASWITKDLPSQLVFLDFELRVIKILNKLKFDVIYKAHPASFGRVNFLCSYAKVIFEKFESVMDMADAYIFYRPMTTTFYEAFCTKKPIIYIHNLHRDWEDDFALIKKRCRIVPAKFDNKNRLVFDENELFEALNKKPEEPNIEFLERYLFPQ